MSGKLSLRERIACTVLVAVTVMSGVGASVRELKPRKVDETAAILPNGVYPKAPEVVLARRTTLPAVFREAVPASIADLKDFETRTQGLVKKVSPAVVAVELRGGTGSGVVISKDGLVLTAAHVSAEPFLDCTIRFPDGTTAKAKTLGTDHDMDAGLVQIIDKGKWPHAEMGEMANLQRGDWVMALGHPGGFDKTRTIVARLGRILSLRFGILQTDCTLIGGDSGGPLFDMHGRVIGIHSRISNATTENFHVPIDAYSESWDRLARGESWGDEEPPTYSWVGIRCADRTVGCRIERVEEDGPGDRAELKVGDIIKKVNDHEVKDYMAFLTQVSEAGRVAELPLTIKRDGKEMAINVKYPGRFTRGAR